MWALVTFHFFACGTKSLKYLWPSFFLKRAHSKRLSTFFYHFGLFLFEGAQTLPPAHDTTLCLHQAAANVVETLLLLGGPGQWLKIRLILEHFSLNMLLPTKQQKTLVKQNKCSCQINLFWEIINILWESNTRLTTTIWLVGLKRQTSARVLLNQRNIHLKGSRGERLSVSARRFLFRSLLSGSQTSHDRTLVLTQASVKLWGAAWASQELDPKTGLNRSMPKPRSPTENNRVCLEFPV